MTAATGAGYSETPLVRKLGLEPDMRVRLIDPPDGYWGLLGVDPPSMGLDELPDDGGRADFTHLFATDPDALHRAFAVARAGMQEAGMVWASWPKKSSGMQASVGRSEVMAAGKEAGLVDVKVCAVDATWSGLKFVIPVADRAK